jgi:hypothetical protein
VELARQWDAQAVTGPAQIQSCPPDRMPPLERCIDVCVVLDETKTPSSDAIARRLVNAQAIVGKSNVRRFTLEDLERSADLIVTESILKHFIDFKVAEFDY